MTDETLGLGSSAGTLLNTLLSAYARKVKECPDYAWFVDEDYDRRRFRKERLAVIRSIWVLLGREVIYNAIEAKGRFARFFTVCADEDEKGEEITAWQRQMIQAGSQYILRAGGSQDEEFEEFVRREGVLKRMYTVSASL